MSGVLGVLVAGMAGVSARQLDLAPTPLEAFAARPGATLVWSEPLGHLESPASLAIATAIVYEDPTATPRLMRGARVSLLHLQPAGSCNLRFLSHAVLCARPDAAIYFDEDSFARVREGLTRGNAEANLIISFRQGRPDVRITGIIIGGYTFDGREPLDLIRLIDAAADALGSAPR